MKAVMISIQPKWVEKIANGNKTIEVRKTRPKIDTPFKCYIYATKSGDRIVLKNDRVYEIAKNLTGKVIGEFVCDRVDEWEYRGYTNLCGTIETYGLSLSTLETTCLTHNEMLNYGNGKTLYAWHISDLVIYDEPKELSEFWAYNAELNKLFNEGEDCCAWGRCETENGCSNDCDTENILHCYQCWEDWNGWCHRLTRPPQSWCYVEEKE